MCKEGNRDAAIVWITDVSWVLVVHRGIHDLEKLSIEIFLWVWARGIYHNSVEVVQVSVSQASLSKGRIRAESLRRGGFCCFLLWLLVTLVCATAADVRDCLAATGTIEGLTSSAFLGLVLGAFGSAAGFRLLRLVHLYLSFSSKLQLN